MFDIKLGITDPDKRPVTTRLAVRAVIFYEDRLLLVNNHRGDYKFPGGGVKNGETHETALQREVAEETGYIDLVIGELLGTVDQREIDYEDPQKYFFMRSYYYRGQLLSMRQKQQRLDDYEIKLAFRPEFVTLSQALRNNEKLINSNQDRELNRWIYRDTAVLRYMSN